MSEITLEKVIEMMALIPKVVKRTVVTNDQNVNRICNLYAPRVTPTSSPLFMSSIPNHIASWATQIYLVPDELLPMITEFADKFGGEAADKLLSMLAEMTKVEPES